MTQDVCSTIGSNLQSSQMPSNANSFYLNTARPAGCNGTVTRLDYCYYGFSGLSSVPYTATVAFYRPSTDGSYTRVSDTITITHSPLPAGFNCETYNLSREVTLQQDDVIGTCIYEIGGNTQRGLRLVTRQNNGFGYNMMRASTNDAGCTTGTLPEVLNGLTPDETRRVLHLQAVINAPPNTTGITKVYIDTESIIIQYGYFT